MSVYRRSCNRAAVCRGRGFLDTVTELGSNIDVGSVINKGSKVIGPLLEKLGIIQPPSRGGRGRGGVYKNQGSGRFKKGSAEARKYMAKLRSMRGKGAEAGVKAVTDFSQLSKDEMLDFMKMEAAMNAYRQNKQQSADSDDEDDD